MPGIRGRERGKDPIPKRGPTAYSGRMVAPEHSLTPPTDANPPAGIPSFDEIRDYAHHLYLQRGAVDGHAEDDWLEAQACLAAAIPQDATRTRMHRHTQLTERAVLPLVKHGRANPVQLPPGRF